MREHLLEKVPVSQVCDKHGVSVVNCHWALQNQRQCAGELLAFVTERESRVAAQWIGELHYRTIKQTWGFAALRSRTPETALQEQRWRFVSLWALRHLAVHHLVA